MLLKTYGKLRFGVGTTMATRNQNEHKRNADSFTAIQKTISLFH